MCTGRDDAEMATAVAGTRGLLAFYGSTPAYRPVLDAHGWGDLQPELNAMSKQGRWDEMSALIDDEMLDTLAVRGEPAAIAAEILRRYGAVADRVGFYTPYLIDPARSSRCGPGSAERTRSVGHTTRAVGPDGSLDSGRGPDSAVWMTTEGVGTTGVQPNPDTPRWPQPHRFRWFLLAPPDSAG